MRSPLGVLSADRRHQHPGAPDRPKHAALLAISTRSSSDEQRQPNDAPQRIGPAEALAPNLASRAALPLRPRAELQALPLERNGMLTSAKPLSSPSLLSNEEASPLALLARFFRVKGSPHSPEPGGDSPEPSSASNEQNEADQGLALMTFPQMTSSQTMLPLARGENRVDRPSLNEARYYASQRAFEREQVREVAQCLVARCLIAP